MSLKEIKARIASVGNTRKTTSAMKMVSSVKLRKAQQVVQSALPYVDQLDSILKGLVSMPDIPYLPILHERPVHNVAIVAVSSDSSLCGGFNSNIIRHTSQLYAKYKSECGAEPLLYVVGQKITDFFSKSGIPVNKSYSGILAKRNYNDAATLADELVGLFEQNVIDKAVIAYTHFKSAGSQVITDFQLFPIEVTPDEEGETVSDFILEPTAGDLLSSLLPRVIRMRLYSAMTDSFCSEQAARMIAMQTATDNADTLLGELTLQYNKLRQQAITNELLDLAGGQIEQ